MIDSPSDVVSNAQNAHPVTALTVPGSATPAAPATSSVVERELSELRSEVTRTRPLIHMLRRVNAVRFAARFTLGPRDRDLFDEVARLVGDYDAVVAPELRLVPSPAQSVEDRAEDAVALPVSADYDRAIYHLSAAQQQLAPDGRDCRVCGDSGHQAFECPHNPMVIMRAFALVSERLRSLHEALHQVGTLFRYV